MSNKTAKVITITNQKGGVGKTSVAVNLADALGHVGYKVLLIDVDSQRDSSKTFGADLSANNLYDLLMGECSVQDAIQTTPIGDIIPAGTELSDLEKEDDFKDSHTRDERYYVLKNALTPVLEEYDYIIFDTPPKYDVYVYNALAITDGVIIPVLPDQYSMDGLGGMIDHVYKIRDKVNSDLRIYGVLFNMTDERKRLDRGLIGNLPEIGKKLGFKVFDTKVRMDQKVKEAQTNSSDKENKSLFENYSRSNAAVDYVYLVQELMKVINNG